MGVGGEVVFMCCEFLSLFMRAQVIKYMRVYMCAGYFIYVCIRA